MFFREVQDRSNNFSTVEIGMVFENGLLKGSIIESYLILMTNDIPEVSGFYSEAAVKEELRQGLSKSLQTSISLPKIWSFS